MYRLMLLILLLFISAPVPVSAGLPSDDRINIIEANIRREVDVDLASPWPTKSPYKYQYRKSIDGQTVNQEVIEYWVDLECFYCDISQPLLAIRHTPGLLILARHSPSSEESLKKALSYEALKKFSVNAANKFWDDIKPKTSLTIPVPYALSLRSALAAASIDPAEFSKELAAQVEIVSLDLEDSSNITSTPTYIMCGIRFPACDFTADELLAAYQLAKSARAGDKVAKEKIISTILYQQLKTPEL